MHSSSSFFSTRAATIVRSITVEPSRHEQGKEGDVDLPSRQYTPSSPAFILIHSDTSCCSATGHSTMPPTILPSSKVSGRSRGKERTGGDNNEAVLRRFHHPAPYDALPQPSILINEILRRSCEIVTKGELARRNTVLETPSSNRDHSQKLFRT